MATHAASKTVAVKSAAAKTAAAKTAAATTAATPFAWGNSMPCVATYNLLEHDDKMDEFEDKDFPFDTAGALTMDALRFWPGLGLPAGGIDSLALLKAQQFRNLLVKNFTGTKQDPAMGKAEVIRALAKVFGKKSATLLDLAAVVKASFTFPSPT